MIKKIFVSMVLLFSLSPLFSLDGREALRINDWKAFKEYLSNTDINALDQDGFSILHYAAGYGNMEAVAIILSNGGQPGIRDRSGNSAVYHAVKNMKIGTAAAILDYYPELSGAVEPWLSSYLSGGWKSLQAYLKNKGLADVFGRSPLFYALVMDDRETVVKLLDLGYEPSLVDKEGLTAVDYALEAEALDSILFLTNKGHDIRGLVNETNVAMIMLRSIQEDRPIVLDFLVRNRLIDMNSEYITVIVNYAWASDSRGVVALLASYGMAGLILEKFLDPVGMIAEPRKTALIKDISDGGLGNFPLYLAAASAGAYLLTALILFLIYTGRIKWKSREPGGHPVKAARRALGLLINLVLLTFIAGATLLLSMTAGLFFGLILSGLDRNMPVPFWWDLLYVAAQSVIISITVFALPVLSFVNRGLAGDRFLCFKILYMDKSEPAGRFFFFYTLLSLAGGILGVISFLAGLSGLFVAVLLFISAEMSSILYGLVMLVITGVLIVIFRAFVLSFKNDGFFDKLFKVSVVHDVV